ncbi:MAG: type II secretion system minor pseudopilin GspI [Gammaproteobacteria bacterium]|nr:type II secretion system minor pseudopilin GspI [Gammaproteobacteria bacterium]MDH5730638.1 type II secretion system minor pseudopilin GspI [Gammaproteobacteria bacterium]
MRIAKAEQAFTLVEVLIAVAVIAISLGAIFQTMTSSAKSVSYLRDKTFAHWVAMNRIAEIQGLNQWPDVGIDSGSEEMGNHEWVWRTVVKPADKNIPNLRQMEIEVFRDQRSKKPLARLRAIAQKTSP